MKKKLLIAGGGYADIPMIQAAKKLGYYVITSGNKAGDLGHKYSDECVLEDFSDKEAMLRLSRNLRIDAICSSCNDFSALTSAYVAENMGLPGHDSYETALLIHHKDRYRDFAQRHDLLSPAAQGYESIQDAVSELDSWIYPIIVKPVDLTGGKGIAVAHTLQEARDALDFAFSQSRAKRVVIEKFISGSRHGFSAFIRDGKVVFHFNDNEHYFINPYLVSAASTPGGASEHVVSKLISAVEKIAMMIGLVDGLFHVQHIISDGEPYIIEICRRPPGDLYTRFVEIATGVPYPEYIVRAAAGLGFKELAQKEPLGYFARHCVMPAQSGILQQVSFSPEITNNIIEKCMWYKAGDLIVDRMIHKCGIIFMEFPTGLEMNAKMSRIHDLVRAEVIPTIN